VAGNPEAEIMKALLFSFAWNVVFFCLNLWEAVVNHSKLAPIVLLVLTGCFYLNYKTLQLRRKRMTYKAYIEDLRNDTT
jgi:hypothetical protein